MLSRRRLLTAGTLATAGAALSAPQAAAGYSHRRTPLRVPARRWTRIGAVPAGRDEYGVQTVLRGRPRVARVRFVREYPNGRLDGTGDQTYLVGRVEPFNITHWHHVQPFRGRMRVLLWVDRPVTLRYVIIKSR